jgi:hypothetical protein
MEQLMASRQSEDVRTERQVVEHHYLGCCWPDGQRAQVFWGSALIALGAVWLAGNLFGLDDWGRWLAPILFIAWGAGLLVKRTSGEHR